MKKLFSVFLSIVMLINIAALSADALCCVFNHDFNEMEVGPFLSGGPFSAVTPGCAEIVESGDPSRGRVLKISGCGASSYAKMRTASAFSDGLVMTFNMLFPAGGTTTSSMLYVSPADADPYDGDDAHFKNACDFCFITAKNSSSAGAGIGAYKFVDGKQSTLSRVSAPVPTDVWLSVKAVRSGGYMYVKLWKTGAAEPDAWNISTVIPNYESEYVTFAFRGANGCYTLIDDLCISIIDEFSVVSVNGSGWPYYVAVSTRFEDIGLPDALTVKLSDGSERSVGVVWNSDEYDGDTPGEQKISGRLSLPDDVTNPGALSPTVSVMVTDGDTAAARFGRSTIWSIGELEDISAYHVYGLTTTNAGTVLAYCEARKNGGDAGDPHHIVLKRSTDGGRSWSKTVILAEHGDEHCYANPVAMVDSITGRIILFYAENFSSKSTVVYKIYSDDDGLSWSLPEDMNYLFDNMDPALPVHLPGPGHGIQITQGKYAGRLVMVVWHRLQISAPDRRYTCDVIYSDDGGDSWTAGEHLTIGYGINETRVAETDNGVLYLNCRTMKNSRMSAVSYDGGETFSEPENCDGIPEYTKCDSGLLGFSVKPASGVSRLIFSHPDDLSLRRNMTVRLSYDNGVTWPVSKVIYQGGAGHGYSDLTLLSNGDIGMLYCEGGNICFAAFSLAWLTDGEDHAPVMSPVSTADGIKTYRRRCFAGDTVAVKVAPPEGKMLKSGSLNYTAGGVTKRIVNQPAGTAKGAGAGDVFTFKMPAGNVTVNAEFVDVTSTDFSTATIATSIHRDNSNNVDGIRFLSRLYLPKMENGLSLDVKYNGTEYKVTDFGTIMLPKTILGENELTVDTDNVLKAPAMVGGSLYDLTQNYVDFTVLMMFKPDKISRVYSTRAYIELTDILGNVTYVYGDTFEKSAAEHLS